MQANPEVPGISLQLGVHSKKVLLYCQYFEVHRKRKEENPGILFAQETQRVTILQTSIPLPGKAPMKSLPPDWEKLLSYRKDVIKEKLRKAGK